MLWWKFAKFLMSFLKAQVTFPSNVTSLFNTIKQNSPTLFLAQTLSTLFKRIPLKVQIFDFFECSDRSKLAWGIWQILTEHSISKICNLMGFFWTKSKMFELKKSIGDFCLIVPIFEVFLVLESKFVKFLMSILNWQFNSSSNFASFSIIKTQNSPVNFKLIHFLLWIKGSYQSPNF